MAQESEHEVHHDREAHRFYVEIEGKTSYLDYTQKDPSTVDYRSTFTPPELRGRGLAGQVVQHALDWARHHEIRVIPSCPFVRDFVDQHPEYEAVTQRPD